MSSVVRSWSGVALLCIATLVPVATAQSDRLQAAVELFEQQDYIAAQAALLEVDRDELTEAERAQLDMLLQVVPKAIQASEKSLHDLAAGDEAYEAGDWDEADARYRAVAENEFARAAIREHAAVRLERIREKRGLAEAARPEGPVEGGEPSPEAEESDQDDTTGQPGPAGEQAPGEEPAAPPAAAETPRRLTPTDQLRLRDELLWQRSVARSQALAQSVRDAIAADDYVQARQLLDTALQTIEAARNYAEPVSKYQTARDAVLQLRAELEQAAAAHATRQAATEREEIANRIRMRKQLYEQQKAEKIEQLFNSAEQLRRERRFGEAAEVLREVLRIDPANAKARFQLEVAEDYEAFTKQADWNRDLRRQQQLTLMNAEEALIPWDIDVLYPRNWPELTARRAALGERGTAADLEDVGLNRKLDETLADIRFEQQPFEQVIEFLGDYTKVNISVDWTNLDDNGIDRDTPVSVRLTSLPFRVVLDEVLDQVGGEVQLAYSIGDGLLRIATKEKLDRDKHILIYDIRDLLINIPRANRAAAFDVTQGLGEGGGAGGGGGGGQGMFGQSQGMEDRNQEGDEAGQGREELIEDIMDIIRQTVEPDSWRETGGGDASIRELNGQLIIYNTSDAHRQVEDLLEQLRETRALQISVETRFLNVTSNFLEEFGVDLDFVFNAGNAGYDRALSPDGQLLSDPFTGAPVLIDRRYSRIGSFAAPPGFGLPLTQGTVPAQPFNQAAFVPGQTGGWGYDYMTPVTAQQGSLSLVDLTGRSTGVPGSFADSAALTPALNIAGSFLDNLQVDFLIRATQANARSSVVQAPRLVLFNGQASSISVGRSRAYVASLEPRLAEGAVGFQPEIQNADSGVNMWVEGTINADRRYVTMTVDVQQRDEPTFIRFEVQRASGSSPGAFILLPDYAFAVLTTTVSIPDGGTVLLGGLKQVGEVEVEAGVPVLSKIPVLKRAFTNQSMVKDVRTLLILVKTKIIIQKEAEDEAFPTFSSAGG